MDVVTKFGYIFQKIIHLNLIGGLLYGKRKEGIFSAFLGFC